MTNRRRNDVVEDLTLPPELLEVVISAMVRALVADYRARHQAAEATVPTGTRPTTPDAEADA